MTEDTEAGAAKVTALEQYYSFVRAVRRARRVTVETPNALDCMDVSVFPASELSKVLDAGGRQMTDETHDTSAEAVERPQWRQYEGVRWFRGTDYDALAARLREVEAERDACRDAYAETADQTHERVKKLNYKLAEAREVIVAGAEMDRHPVELLRLFRDALAQLDADQPAPRDGVTVGEWQPIESAPTEEGVLHLRGLWVHTLNNQGKSVPVYFQVDCGVLNENEEFVSMSGDDFGWSADDYDWWMPVTQSVPPTPTALRSLAEGGE